MFHIFTFLCYNINVKQNYINLIEKFHITKIIRKGVEAWKKKLKL